MSRNLIKAKMTTKENKRAVSALFLAVALFAAGCAGYLLRHRRDGRFMMVVAVICAVFA